MHFYLVLLLTVWRERLLIMNHLSQPRDCSGSTNQKHLLEGRPCALGFWNFCPDHMTATCSSLVQTKERHLWKPGGSGWETPGTHSPGLSRWISGFPSMMVSASTCRGSWWAVCRVISDQNPAMKGPRCLCRGTHLLQQSRPTLFQLLLHGKSREYLPT